MKANGIDVKATIYAKCIQKSGDCSWTEHDLQVGAYYKVEKIEMGQSYTSIYLEEFFRVYNSVYFEFYENGKEINIYKDKRFNPYIQEDFDCGYHEHAKERHKNMKYLEISEDYADCLWKVGAKINIAVYQGVYGNDFVKEYTKSKPSGTSWTIAWQVKEILKELPNNRHYTFKFYERVD